jgi:hypothetical protein
MRKGEGSVTIPRVETNDLHKKILVDGQTVTVSEASAEQFDIYVYTILYQMYEKKGHAHNRYELSFYEYDFSEPLPRIFALNKLRKLNQIRMGTPTFKAEIPLFAEEM